MHRQSTILRSLAFGSAAFLAATVAMAEGGKTFEDSCNVAAGAAVDVEIVSGSVEVVAWAEDKVSASAVLGKDLTGLEFDCQANRVTIGLPDDIERRSGKVEIDVALTLKVPRKSVVAIETVSADVNAAGLEGALSLESVSGVVKATGSPASLAIETVSSNVDVDVASDNVAIESVSGKVRLGRAGKRVSLASVSGDVEVAGGTVTSAEIESVSGNVTFNAGLAPGARLSVECHSGKTVLKLPAGVGATFDVTTFSGEIENQLGPAATEDDGPGKELHFSTGDGSARVEIESFSGDVRLLAR